MGGKAYLAHPSSYFAKVGTKEEVKLAYDNTIKFVKDFLAKFSPKENKKTPIDGAEIYHPSYLGNIDVISEIKELVQAHRIASSGGTDIHVDKTLGKDETVSSDSLDGTVVRNKLRKFRLLRRKAVSIRDLKSKALEMKDGEER